MKPLLRLILPVVGVLLIVATLASGVPSHGRSGVGFFLSLLLGGAFIVSPFLALGIALMYTAMLLFIVGGPVLGGIIGAQIGGKDSLAVWVGLIAGGYLGIKFATSDHFEALMKPIRRISSTDDASGEP